MAFLRGPRGPGFPYASVGVTCYREGMDTTALQNRLLEMLLVGVEYSQLAVLDMLPKASVEEARHAIRTLVNRGDLCITLDWKLRLREPDEPDTGKTEHVGGWNIIEDPRLPLGNSHAENVPDCASLTMRVSPELGAILRHLHAGAPQ